MQNQSITSMIVQYLPIAILYAWNWYLHSGHTVNATTLAEVKAGLATTAEIVSGLSGASQGLQATQGAIVAGAVAGAVAQDQKGATK